MTLVLPSSRFLPGVTALQTLELEESQAYERPGQPAMALCSQLTPHAGTAICCRRLRLVGMAVASRCAMITGSKRHLDLNDRQGKTAYLLNRTALLN
jgi:hypothetical protein